MALHNTLDGPNQRLEATEILFFSQNLDVGLARDREEREVPRELQRRERVAFRSLELGVVSSPIWTLESSNDEARSRGFLQNTLEKSRKASRLVSTTLKTPNVES